MHRALVCGGVLPLVFACSSGEVDSGSASTSASGAASASGSGDASESGDSDATETDGNTEGSGASGGTGETGSSRGVDLALTSIELAPSSPAVGDGVWISASLKNHGADGLDLPVRLGFAIDGVPQVALGREVVGLGAGQEIEMRAAVAWIPEEGGVVEVAAVVDADATLDELDEADNFTAVEVSVGGGEAKLCRTIGGAMERCPSGSRRCRCRARRST